MATSNPVLFNGVSSPQSIYEISTTKKHPIGTPGMLADGRRFHYASQADATAIGPNKLAQSCPPVPAHVSETGALTGTDVAGSVNLSAALGATAAFANEYENGFLKIESATTGAGQIFRIPQHALTALSTALSFKTSDPVVTATSGTTTWSLVHNAWGAVVIQPTTITANAAGVTMVNWPAATTTALNYGWLQTWGVASCLMDTTAVVAGSGLIVGAVAGSLGVSVETDIKQRVGWAIEAMATDNVYVSVFLTIA